MERKISNLDLLSVAFKSFFIQSSWNFERMQALGFLHSISKTLNKLYEDSLLLKKTLLKHLEFFNTNPYLSPIIIGVVLNWEEKKSRSKESDIDSGSLKAKLMGPFGAIGDSLFWAAFRPLAAIIGTLFAFKGVKYAPLYFLLIYNIPTVTVRFYGLFMGYQLGERVIGEIKKINFNLYIKRIKELSSFLVGIFLGAYAMSPFFVIKGIGLPTNVILELICICIFLLFLKKKIPVVFLIYILAVVCVGLKYIE